MAEPEDVLIEGAHAATTFVARLWRRHALRSKHVQLGDVRPRLELLVGAVFADAPHIVSANPPASPSFVGRLAWRIPRHLIDEREHASSDAARICLPRSLPDVSLYRLMAVEQAARVQRGTSAVLQAELGASLPRRWMHGEPAVVRDLYYLSEGVANDHWIASQLPGLAHDLEQARRVELNRRTSPTNLTPIERAVEAVLLSILSAPPLHPPAEIPLLPTARGSLEWARDKARTFASVSGRFRGLPPVLLWGDSEPQIPDALLPGTRSHSHQDDPASPAGRTQTLRRRPRVRPSPDDEDDGQSGMWMIQLDDPQEHVEDPMGLQRPADQDAQKDADDLADSLAELPEARLVLTPGNPAEVLTSDDRPPHSPMQPRPDITTNGIAYPEWDHRIEAYHEMHAVVRERAAVAGSAEWVARVRMQYAPEIANVRRRFERLRPRRVRMTRQLDGNDVDVAAFAECHADLRAGIGTADRLYETVCQARRGLAVSLLVDISGSTDSWLSDQRRIIDVEKEALLLVCEALDALGDRYAVSAFSGEGPRNVIVSTIKRFDERYGMTTRLRIAGLEHDRFTRMGTALRQMTSQLCRERAHHRLLLLLTDGKPNDVDVYEGRYGIEDTRQAVVEARMQGVHPFCITVDREAPTYIPRMFGANGYSILRRADTLPNALVDVVRRLVHT